MHIELCERRALLATATFSDGTLAINGGSHSEDVEVFSYSSGTHVYSNDVLILEFDASTWTQVNANLGDGNDKFRYRTYGVPVAWAAVVHGDGGADTLYLPQNLDTVSTTLYGDAGDDILYCHNSAGLISGGIGSDVLQPEGGVGLNVTIDGLQNDSYEDSYARKTNVFNVESDIETLRGSGYDDAIYGGSANEYISGQGGNDSIRGNGGNDTLEGSAGNDTIEGGSGGDHIIGGNNNDEVTYSTRTNALTISTDDIFNDGESGEGDSVSPSTERVRGGSGNDFITGSGYNNVFRGGGGLDTLYGYAGDDQLWGDDGNDSLFGGGGNDALYGVDGNDALNGSDGADTLDGGNGTDTKDVDALDTVRNVP